ncbi:hypothetical protein Q5762_32905 [Streptomyces sp. P9(2023)]|uniref:hypothetical protein n=1 Tax=Streptomyces sp. P9(2023) TaxID=3064394 RepID=UPI0028F4031B|nr:hypothetical protein [Streptomyces sp. P9(2023)]MDT9693041.1 hypothetical protein [Streptomyces sp. P9(2023)]
MTEASGERSVAAGGGIGRVNTGDHVTQVERATLLPAEALTVAPEGLVHLPERTKLFVGRARELTLLDEGEGIQVICGLGGIGKSTLAARWAADRVADHTVVWWITAETPAELDAGLAELARAMQPAVVGVLPEDALRERALQWLATHEGWLLVLDNVSTPSDLRPLLARAGDGGRILVTSRRASGWQDYCPKRPCASGRCSGWPRTTGGCSCSTTSPRPPTSRPSSRGSPGAAGS